MALGLQPQGRMTRLAPALALLALIGCGDDGDRTDSGSADSGADAGPMEDAGPAAVALRIDPADAEVAGNGIEPGALAYRALLQLDDGTEVDVTAEAVFSVGSSALGAFDGATFLSAIDRGGATTVTAVARGRSATTGLTVRIVRVALDVDVPADAPDRFAGAETATGAPRLVYPADGVLLPPNLRELEIHFLAGSATAGTIYELSFHGRFVEARLYVTCRVLGTGCQTVLPDAIWALLAGNERGADPIPYRIRSVRPGSTEVAAGSGQTLAFAEEEITGGLYYWNASRGSIQRYEFGLRGAFPEDYLDPARAGAFSCVGCHTLSRDGSRIAVGLDEPVAPPYRVFDVATREVMFSIGSSGRADGAGFYTFSPDARQVMAAENGGVYLRDSDSGAPLARIVETGTMPDWSPSGERIVYALPPCTDPMFCGFDIRGASLETAVWDGMIWSLGPELVPFTGANNYYPTFSPDGGWVMFNRSPSNASSFGAPDGQVWVVDADGGDPIALGTAQGPGDSWPKWDPTVYMHRGHPLFWFTFSSRKAVGVRPDGGFGPFGTQSQLWMAAFDPTRADAGDDPAFPAFWLPFQDAGGGNHIAQWVTRVERMPCEMDVECETGEVCREGVCVPDLI